MVGFILDLTDEALIASQAEQFPSYGWRFYDTEGANNPRLSYFYFL